MGSAVWIELSPCVLAWRSTDSMQLAGILHFIASSVNANLAQIWGQQPYFLTKRGSCGYSAAMPRSARLVITDLPYHITQRGNNRAQVFLGDSDRRLYLELLQRYCAENQLTMMGYCLMGNHVHLIALPRRADSLARGVGIAHLRYTQLFNARHGNCGHLWQGRFFACALDDAHLVAAMRYVERNPVRAGMVEYAWQYPWSSAAAHVGRPDVSGFPSVVSWREQWPAGEWKKMLARREDEEQLQTLRLQTRTGRPLGDKSFISRLERMLGRSLGPKRAGRPRKDLGEGG